MGPEPGGQPSLELPEDESQLTRANSASTTGSGPPATTPAPVGPGAPQDFRRHTRLCLCVLENLVQALRLPGAFLDPGLAEPTRLLRTSKLTGEDALRLHPLLDGIEQVAAWVSR